MIRHRLGPSWAGAGRIRGTLQREAARLISEASGGFAIIDSPDLNADLDRSLDDLDNYRNGAAGTVALVDSADAVAWSSPVLSAADGRFETVIPLVGVAAGPKRLRVTVQGATGTASREVGITVR